MPAYTASSQYVGSGGRPLLQHIVAAIESSQNVVHAFLGIASAFQMVRTGIPGSDL